VQASAQSELYHTIKEGLTEEELTIFKRGRNAKSFTSAKNAGMLEYKTATGLEALIGYLYLTDRMDRLMELMRPQFERLLNNDNKND
jgi:ribonuclease-3 family protein